MTSRETNSTGDEDIIVTKSIRSVSGMLPGGHDDGDNDDNDALIFL